MMRQIIRATTLLFGTIRSSFPAVAQTEKKFANDMKRRFEAHWPGIALSPVDGDPLSLHREATNGFDEGTIHLHRIYDYCKTASAADCDSRGLRGPLSIGRSVAT